MAPQRARSERIAAWILRRMWWLAWHGQRRPLPDTSAPDRAKGATIGSVMARRWIVRLLLAAALLGLGAVSFTPLKAASPTCPDAPGCLGSPDWDALYPTLPPDNGAYDVPCPGDEECLPYPEEEALNAASPTCPGARTCMGGPNWDEVPDPPDADKNDVPCPGIEECPSYPEEEAPGDVPHPSN